MMPVLAPDSGAIRIRIVDGKRQPVPADQDTLIRILDGRKQQVLSPWATGPSLVATGLPYHDNPDDLYTVFAHSKGYTDAAVYPVQIKQGSVVNADLMMLPKDGQFHFKKWGEMQTVDPQILQLLTNGVADPAVRYQDTLEAAPLTVGALLTIGAAIHDIALEDQTNPLRYYWEVIWDALAPDRFWAWVDARLADRIKTMADLNAFAGETDPAHWHPGIPGRVPPVGAATRSWKQTRFDVTNVQLTFHENDKDVRRTPLGGLVPCVIVEPDIDYYKDLLAHGLLEVLPNSIGRGKTDPRTVYALRWMAARQEGLPDFDPPCTIE